MASLLDSLLGQQDAPDLKTVSVNEILKKMTKSLPKLREINDTWNMDQAVGGATAQRAGEDIYDPNRGAIRERAGSLILQSLENPYSMPPELLALLRQQGLEGAAGSGLNASEAGRAGMFGLLGKEAESRAQSLINRGAAYGANTANLYNPSAAVTPGDVGSAFVNQNDQQNAFNKYLSDLDYQNDLNLINRPLQLTNELDAKAGRIFGAVMGTGAIGGMMGGGGSPTISPGTYGGSGQPSYQTLQWALPGSGR